MFRREPALWLGAVQAILAVILAFGIELTATQTGAILAVTAAILALITRSVVTPVEPDAGG